jgi:hypothetical protein
LVRLKAQSNITELRTKIFFNKFYSENKNEDDEDTTRTWNGSELKSSQEEIMIGRGDKTNDSTADNRNPFSVMSAKQKDNDLSKFVAKSQQNDCECIKSGQNSRFSFGFSFLNFMAAISVSITVKTTV